MKSRIRTSAIVLGVLLGGCRSFFALNPSLDISQYAHTAWTVRDGFSLGNVYAMAQGPDGYLWFGTEFGLFRFDGIHSSAWQPPAGQQIPGGDSINSLLFTRDGTLWIGTFAGLVTLKDGKLTPRPEVGRHFVSSLFEDREGTVWVGTLGPPGGLLAIRSGSSTQYGEHGAFGRAVWAMHEDSSGTLWAAAQSGLWRIKPSPPRRYPTPTELIGLTDADDGKLLLALHGAGLLRLAGDTLGSYPIRGANNSTRLLRDRDVDSNRVLRDRDGGLWIATVERGLIHLHNGRTDVFSRADGLSGDVILSIMEDREGDVWVASTGGLDRFRELPVSTVSAKQGLSSDAAHSVLAAADGSIWIGAHDRLTRWQNGKATIFGKANGLPDDVTGALYQDGHGRIWVSTPHGLAYFDDDRFVARNGVSGEEVHYMAGDKTGNLWLSGQQVLSHLRDGRLVKQIPWSELGRAPNAQFLLPEKGGVWIGFWVEEGALSYFKDGRLLASYTTADGLSRGVIADLQLDRDGALWISSEISSRDGGLGRLKNGRITTLTTRNGLPCGTINWTMEDDDRSFWLYTSCGLVRIARAELDAWVADPNRKVQITVWDAADGVRLRSSAASEYGPRVTKTADGKIWFVTGEGVQVVDPHHLADNKLPPPVHIEQIVADHKMYWQNLPGAAASSVHLLPARTHDLQIYYTALSLVAPEKVHFKFKLEGQDLDWREVVNDRDVQYSNLGPGPYRFRVIACNNSGVWNEQGDALEFSIAPAYYQTNWFRALCAVLVLALVWAIYQLRLRQLRHDFALTLEARVAERTNIARDLHDTLLQSAQGLLLQLEVLSQMQKDRPIEAKEKLAEIINRTADAITEGRDAVQGLRASTVQTNDLARAINTLGQEFATDPAKDGSPAFRVTVEGDSRDLHPIMRDEVYRIAGEALRNAFRHAQARQIEVEIRYDNQQFRLRVRDDGRGMDATVLSGEGVEGHYGLRGLHERARLIGGKLVVWSEVGVGTEVELFVPASSAYTTTRRGSWLSQKFAGKS